MIWSVNVRLVQGLALDADPFGDVALHREQPGRKVKILSEFFADTF